MAHMAHLASRLSTATISSEKSKRWSMPSLQNFDLNTATGPSSGQFPQEEEDDTPRQKSLSINRPARISRGASITGTSFGKPDFGAPPASTPSTVERRASKRISRISKLSDVSEAESITSRGRAMSVSVPPGPLSATINEDTATELPIPTPGSGSKRMSLSRRMSSVADDLAQDSERRRSRRISMMSTASSARKLSVQSRLNAWQQTAEPTTKAKTWDEDFRKPSNWNSQSKGINTAICCYIAFCYCFTLTMYAMATKTDVQKLSSNMLVTLIPYAMFALGFVFGPIFANPFIQAHGRKHIFLITIPLYAVFLIVGAIVKNLAVIAVCRFLAAFFAGPGLFMSYGIISDLWVPGHETFGVATYVLSLCTGIAVGPIIGGIVVQKQSWRWTHWVALFATVVLLFCAVGMRESQQAAIIRRDKTVEQLELELAERRANRVTKVSSRITYNGNMLVGSTLHMIQRSMALMMTLIYLSYTLGILFMLPTIIPSMFSKDYNSSILSQGLPFVGEVIGIIIACLLIYLMDHFVYSPRVKSWEDHHVLIDGKNNSSNNQSTNSTIAGPTHASWRRGLAVSGSKFNFRVSVASVLTEHSVPRNDSEASTRSRGLRSLKRSSTSSFRKSSSRLPAFSERNINIAIAVTRFLNSQPENQNKKIIVERVMVVLKQTDSYTNISESLKSFGLVFEESLLAKVLVDALSKEKDGSEIRLYRSRSLHQLAAQAALMGTSDENRTGSTFEDLASPSSETNFPPLNVQTGQESKDEERLGDIMLSQIPAPPAKWRWHASLPASVIFPAGLFVLGWTAGHGASYIVPCIGLALVGLGGALISFSSIAYTMELFHHSHRDAAAAGYALVAGTFIMSTALTFAGYAAVNNLGSGPGLSIFAGIAILLGIIPWLIALTGKQETTMLEEKGVLPEVDEKQGNDQVVQIREVPDKYRKGSISGLPDLPEQDH